MSDALFSVPDTLEGIALDLIIGAVVVALMVRGWRRGGVHAAVSLVGLLVGFAAATLVLDAMPSPLVAGIAPAWLVIPLAYLLLGAIGYAVGRRLGAFLTRSFNPNRPTLPDRGLGVAVYGAAGLVVCIVAVSAIAGLPYEPLGDAADRSFLVQNLAADRVSAGELTDRLPGFGDGPVSHPDDEFELGQPTRSDPSEP